MKKIISIIFIGYILFGQALILDCRGEKSFEIKLPTTESKNIETVNDNNKKEKETDYVVYIENENNVVDDYNSSEIKVGNIKNDILTTENSKKEITVNNNQENDESQITESSNQEESKTQISTSINQEKLSHNDRTNLKDFTSIKELENMDRKIILIDKSNGDYCTTAIDYFYSDANYRYYFTCMKSNNMYVIIDNNEYKLVEALKSGIVTIKELEENGYYFNKESRNLYTE